MRSQKLTFKNKTGQSLGARLDLPEGDAPAACALFAHCFTCTKNLKAVGNINRALTDGGIAVLRFDFTGLGESEGDFSDTSFGTNITDLISAADFLEQNFEAPRILIGHSLGGAAVLQAAAQIPSVRAVATIAAPYDPAHVAHLLKDARDRIEAEGVAEVTLGGRPFKIKKQFLDNLEETRVQNTLRNLNKALLIFHAPFDNTVGIDNATQIFQAARHPKSFVSLDRADHLLTEERDSRYVGAVTAAWASRYIDTPQTPPVEPPDDGRVTVTTGRTRYRTEIRSGVHRLLADEPADLGGADTGPSPYDYLAAALGACTSITLRMYADRKDWPLETVTVRLKHEKIHAEDCEHCETRTGKIDRIDRELDLKGPLSRDQIARLLEIADRCPVHRTLHSEIHVDTRLKPGE